MEPTNAIVRFGRAASSSSVLLTCEHASNVIPPPWTGWPEADQHLVGMHWAIDLGAEALARELADDHGCEGFAAGFSRLLCDCNRPLDSETLFRSVADGVPVHLNVGITPEERELRLQQLYHPYHKAIDDYLGQCAGGVRLVFSIHSFTDTYEGQKRGMEVGVLFKEHDALALKVHAALLEAGYKSRLNEPWSGKDGFMHSADLHARTHGAQALMIEARQDLLVQEAWRNKLAHHLSKVLKAEGFV